MLKKDLRFAVLEGFWDLAWRFKAFT